MAHVAAGQLLAVHDPVLGDEAPPERLLVLARPPVELEDVLARPHEALGRLVTAEAPLHVERVRAPEERHLVDAPVTRDAADALVHVDRVVEVREARQVVDAVPADRPAAAVAFAHGLEHRRLRPDLLVAVHADLRRRHAGEGRRLDRRVAVAAIDAEPADVVLVAEGHRLLLWHAHAGRTPARARRTRPPRRSAPR